MTSFKKLTAESTGIWGRVAKMFALVPGRSSGIPLNAMYRRPSPGEPLLPYEEAPQLPAADIAGNPYYKRDTRREYEVSSVFNQERMSTLLCPPSESSEQSSKSITTTTKLNDVLTTLETGLPPNPNDGMKWKMNTDSDAGYGYKNELNLRVWS